MRQLPFSVPPGSCRPTRRHLWLVFVALVLGAATAVATAAASRPPHRHSRPHRSACTTRHRQTAASRSVRSRRAQRRRRTHCLALIARSHPSKPKTTTTTTTTTTSTPTTTTTTPTTTTSSTPTTTTTTTATTTTTTSAAPPPSATGLPALTVAGNQILAGGLPFAFHGVNRDSLEWGQFNWGGCGGDGHFTDTDFDHMAAWHVTAVRLPLSEAGWLGRRCDPAAYASAVDAAVAKANARGMYAILDLHWSDVQGRAPCDSGCRTGQQPMPDADSIVFWRQVAARFANRPGVIFGLYNEPHGVSWGCWRDGGCSVQSSAVTNGGVQVAYTAVGMQQLLDAVRAQGANNLVLAAGLDWAYDLSGVGAGYALSGANVAYDTHVYVQWHSTTSDWDQHVGYLTATRPVTATEFGSTDCTTAVDGPLLDYFHAHGISWTIWSWNSPGSCSQPSVLADWSGTPLSGQGQLIHDRLAALAP